MLDLDDWGGRNLVMADHVHPTAFGQIAIAERALDLLAADGLHVAARPSTLIRYETTRWRRLRGDATYAYRHLKISARALAAAAYRLTGPVLARSPSPDGAGRTRLTSGTSTTNRALDPTGAS